MSICWYCYWGWNQKVLDIYNQYEKLVGESSMDYGPGHIVWADENFLEENIEYCIKYCDELLADEKQREERDISRTDVLLVRDSLIALLKIPEDERCCEPEDYDGNSPENFPPPNSIKMGRK